MNNVRVIITDQCQYRCFYCPFRTGLARPGRLTEERLLEILLGMADAGVENVEISGGEPLLYPGLPGLIERLKTDCRMKKVTMTTNGLLLSECAGGLKKAGLDGINIHVDTLSSDEFRATTGREQLLNEVLKGIWAASAADIPVTVTAAIHENSVSQPGVMAGLARQLPITVRFVSLDESVFEKTREKILRALPRESGSDIPARTEEPIRPAGWKGEVIFGCGITGAFGMEEAVLLGGCLDVI